MFPYMHNDPTEVTLTPPIVDGEEPFVWSTSRYDAQLLHSPENTAASCNRPTPFYVFEHHWTRMQVARWSNSFYNSDARPRSSGGPAILYQQLMNAVKHWQQNHPEQHDQALRVKVRSYLSGRVSTEIFVTPHVPMSLLFPKSFTLPSTGSDTNWTIVMDTQPTEITESTMAKTRDRSCYDRTRAAAGIPSLTATQEVLMYNHDNEIMDASITTPFFHRDGKWVTPASSCGGQQGTTRRWALEHGLCTEAVIPRDSVNIGEVVWLSNGVKGFFWGRVVPRDTPPEQPQYEQNLHSSIGNDLVRGRTGASQKSLAR